MLLSYLLGSCCLPSYCIDTLSNLSGRRVLEDGDETSTCANNNLLRSKVRFDLSVASVTPETLQYPNPFESMSAFKIWWLLHVGALDEPSPELCSFIKVHLWAMSAFFSHSEFYETDVTNSDWVVATSLYCVFHLVWRLLRPWLRPLGCWFWIRWSTWKLSGGLPTKHVAVCTVYEILWNKKDRPSMRASDMSSDSALGNLEPKARGVTW